MNAKKNSKETWFSWEDAGQRGVVKLVDVESLLIDHKYQRPESSRRSHIEIAREFSWDAFGVLSVKDRNGKLYVVDGQQRLCAAKIRGIKKVPCVINDSDGIADEASVFAKINTSRKKVTAIEKFIARATAKLEPETEINTWLKTNGLVVRNTNMRAGEGEADAIKCINKVMIQWKIDAARAQRSVLLSRAICIGVPIHKHILGGVFILLGKGVDVSEHVDKIHSVGGMKAILKAIRVIVIENGLQEASDGLSAIGMLSVINHKRRIRIHMDNSTATKSLKEKGE